MAFHWPLSWRPRGLDILQPQEILDQLQASFALLVQRGFVRRAAPPIHARFDGLELEPAF